MPTIIFRVDAKDSNKEEIELAVDYLKQGKIVAIPTETVYGLAVCATNKEAVEKLYQIKNRPKDKPFTLAIASIEQVEQLSRPLSVFAYKLMYRFWPGPLTLVVKGNDDKTIGLRMPKNNIALKIIEKLGFPVCFPSANITGQEPAQLGEDVLKELDGKVDLIIDSGKVEIGKPSTIVDLTNDFPKIIRDGAIKKEVLENVFKLKTILFVCTGNTCRSVMAKGLLKKEIGDRTDVEVSSCGTNAFDGQPPTFEVLELLKQEGVDLTSNRSRSITKEMLKEADLILTMTQHQKEEILTSFGFVKNRLYLLKEFAKIAEGSLDVEDPISRGKDVYKQTFEDIKRAIKIIAKLI
ncbi:MAG: L-threonylcarbamoyladenylate synthase [Candidatus Omnitrophota bacterium]